MRGVEISIENLETKKPSKASQLTVEAWVEARNLKTSDPVKHFVACVLDDLADRLGAEAAGKKPGEFHSEEL